jgi:hypothetical protein
LEKCTILLKFQEVHLVKKTFEHFGEVCFLGVSPKTKGILFAVCTSPLSIHGLKYDFDTSIETWQFWFKYYFLQDHNRHLNSMTLILWTTKDQTFILISFLGVNKLFYVVGSSYPTTKSPQNINFTISTWFNLRDWTKIQGRVSQSKHSLSPKNLWSSHKTIGILLKTKHIPYPIQNP